MAVTRSLTLKLTLAFLVVSLAGTAVLAFLARRTTATAFDTFVVTQEQAELAEALAVYYEAAGSWNGVERVLPANLFGGPMMGGRGRGGRAAGPTMALADRNGQIIIPGSGYSMHVVVPPEQLENGVPIDVNGQVAGTLLGQRAAPAFAPAQATFLQRVSQALLIASLVATGVALILAALLARTLTRPLRELTTATRSVASGKLGHQVTVRSEDELGELAAAFNQMSEDLANAQSRRRQLTADIAHDLRTPISIIQGHAEALRDGVLPPDTETFTLIHDEALRLNRLVEELRTLSRAEARELSLVRRPVDVEEMLRRVAAAYAPEAQEKKVALKVEAEPALPLIEVDPDRMIQVLNNLLDNALRHTPPGGEVKLASGQDGGDVWLRVQDTGSGIPAEDLPHVFQRFYRGDKARRRHAGGSGLGLAIVKSLVEAHGGMVEATNRPGAGASFTIRIPVN